MKESVIFLYVKSIIMRLAVFLFVPLFAGCAAFPFQQSAEPIDLTSNFESIIAGVTEFNQNSNDANNASTFQDYVTLSNNNKRILANLRKSIETYATNISIYWDEFPEENTIDFPARQTLKDYENAMKNWLQVQEEDQAYMDTCMKDEDTMMGCLMNRFTEIYERQKVASENLRPVLEKLQAWQEEFRS